MFAHACKLGVECVVSKVRDGPKHYLYVIVVAEPECVVAAGARLELLDVGEAPLVVADVERVRTCCKVETHASILRYPSADEKVLECARDLLEQARRLGGQFLDDRISVRWRSASHLKPTVIPPCGDRRQTFGAAFPMFARLHKAADEMIELLTGI